MVLEYAMYELIDTQWDVNDYVVSTMLDAYEELIDTQWDVNEFIGTIKINIF